MLKKFIILSPCRNVEKNIIKLTRSIKTLNIPKNTILKHVLIDDNSNDQTANVYYEYLASQDYNINENIDIINDDKEKEFFLIKNNERKYALKNIIDVAKKFENDDNAIICIVDGDDSLCNKQTLEYLNNAYNNGDVDVVWTAQKWDVNEQINVSGELPDKIDPYQYHWKSSHFRTFRAKLLKQIDDKNFKNQNGEWFKRGYDQALMLPILKVGNKRKYINKVCYEYALDSVSIPLNERNWYENEQQSTVALVRSRGFIKKL